MSEITYSDPAAKEMFRCFACKKRVENDHGRRTEAQPPTLRQRLHTSAADDEPNVEEPGFELGDGGAN